ncbi:type IV secretory system conjugative DNA transfer family protein [Treponema zuelzerae]|uniref:Type IV secretory system conjugative DNA transfer family protein n=1 Tax=Teretinema zuelzerae TaxID=156 RepID=A0AAE3JHB5_9SPIR|nr:type IV secretory system conjugative DNA transfer family protein [Teretinema zuelzerae]MCD1653532.1 type IV secretory system conjugative DNA transfer family protein [Teretinema zuelzerae]
MATNSSEFLRGKPTSGNREQLFAAVNKIFAFIIIFAGLWISTQYFAFLIGYDPLLIGYPFIIIREEWLNGGSYPLYEPWKYLLWLFSFFKDAELTYLLKKALVPWLVISFSAVILYTIITYFRGFRQAAENIFGTARWGTKKDLQKEGLLGNEAGVVYGQLFDAQVQARLNKEKGSVSLHLKRNAPLITSVGITNALLAAPTRSGKGVSTVIPTLTYYHGSVLVLDFKGENFEKTSGYRAKKGKVYRYAPVSESGHNFNPLMEIPGGKDAYGYANLIADTVLTPQAGKSSGDANSEHFREAAIAFLTGVILHVLTSDYPDKTLPGVKAFLSAVNPENPADDTYSLTQMIEGVHCTQEIHQRVVTAAGDQLKRPDRERQSVLSTVQKSLRVFEDPRVRESSMSHDFYIDEFEKTDTPISLYLTMPYAHMSRLAPLVRLFIMLIIRKFTDGETRHDVRKLKVPLLIVLDEFDKLGKFSELQESMGILAGYGIHFLLIIQSPSQLIDIYGRNHQFFAHCKNVLLFAPGEIESGKVCSEMIGKESIWKSSTSTSGTRFSVGLDNLNISGGEQERNLINPDEVMKLPPDQLIILTQGKPPYIAKKCVYYEQSPFKQRLLPPAFTDKKGAMKQCAHNVVRNSGRHWYDLPLFTCLEKTSEVVVDERLIDPWFTNRIRDSEVQKLASQAAGSEAPSDSFYVDDPDDSPVPQVEVFTPNLIGL